MPIALERLPRLPPLRLPAATSAAGGSWIYNAEGALSSLLGQCRRDLSRPWRSPGGLQAIHQQHLRQPRLYPSSFFTTGVAEALADRPIERRPSGPWQVFFVSGGQRRGGGANALPDPDGTRPGPRATISSRAIFFYHGTRSAPCRSVAIWAAASSPRSDPATLCAPHPAGLRLSSSAIRTRPPRLMGCA